MRSLTSLLFCLGAGRALAACPYAAQLNTLAEARSEDIPKVRSAPVPRKRAADDKQGVFYMNRIGPSDSILYIANVDGTDETALLGNQSSFDYHATISPDSEWVSFTTERAGDGQSDVYRVKIDGTGLEKVIDTPSVEDASVISPDGTKIAYVSTAWGYKANIVIQDLTTGEQFNLTNNADISFAADPESPNGYFRPAWSPDGEWITFASDRNTQWTGHSEGVGWEHTQQLAVYIVRPNGTDLRQIVTTDGYCLGSPRWSPDGARLVYYNITVEDTYAARGSGNLPDSQIFSVDVATGTDVIEHTWWTGLKLFPSYVNNETIGYLIKGGVSNGINYTSATDTPTTLTGFTRDLVRAPSWTADGKTVVYEKMIYGARALEKPLYGWQADWDYRFMDVFPQLSLQGRVVMTNKVTAGANSSILNLNPDGTDRVLVFDSRTPGVLPNTTGGGGGGGGFGGGGFEAAYQPAWSPDGERVAFGIGAYFGSRASGSAVIVEAAANGSWYNVLTDGTTTNAGYPSYSSDGTQIVYREWDLATGAPLGLRILNLADQSITNLTDGWDNTPGWSIDGTKIVFTRESNWTVSDGARWYYDRFDIYTINPDGTELTQLTTSPANDAHAVWTHDGRIMYNSGMYGFKDEASIYDNTFQPYGQIVIMNADGSNKTMLTDTLWEDAMPLYVPNEYL
ncbi:tricorn protease N-terminal domain-containing protein [Xylariales sp. PMI_506]|nr:tricorn protease N-terminal domain-containing protein [Xylariales sp. PMI_506]